MSDALVRQADAGWEKLKALALDGVASPHSRRAYASALDNSVELTFARIRQRQQRWVIVDLLGKHGRVRSVPMPGWAKAASTAGVRRPTFIADESSGPSIAGDG
jgi:hypothetical protein